MREVDVWPGDRIALVLPSGVRERGWVHRVVGAWVEVVTERGWETWSLAYVARTT